MWGDSIDSILSNCDNLNKLWEECLETSLQPDIEGRVIGIQTKIFKFNVQFVLKYYVHIWWQFEQNHSLPAAEAQDLSQLTVTTLKKIRADDDFE